MLLSRELTMPAVTVGPPVRPNGLPIAITIWPAFNTDESHSSATSNEASDSTFIMARSVVSSLPTTFPLSTLPSARVTFNRSASSMTWLFVSMWPSVSMMTPEPTPSTGKTRKSWSCIMRTLAMFTTLLLTFSTALTSTFSSTGIMPLYTASEAKSTSCTKTRSRLPVARRKRFLFLASKVLRKLRLYHPAVNNNVAGHHLYPLLHPLVCQFALHKVLRAIYRDTIGEAPAVALPDSCPHLVHHRQSFFVRRDDVAEQLASKLLVKVVKKVLQYS